MLKYDTTPGLNAKQTAMTLAGKILEHVEKQTKGRSDLDQYRNRRKDKEEHWDPTKRTPFPSLRLASTFSPTLPCERRGALQRRQGQVRGHHVRRPEAAAPRQPRARG